MVGEPESDTAAPATPSGSPVAPAGPEAQLERIARLADALNAAVSEFVGVAGLDAGIPPLPEVADGLAGVLASQRWGLRVGDVAARVSGLSERLSLAATRTLVDTDAHRTDAVSTPARWLERHLGLSATDARRLVRCDQALRHLDTTRHAVFCDEIRLAHLDSIARIVPSHFDAADTAVAWDAVAEVQDDLLDAAGHASPTIYAKFCRAVRDRLDLDGPRDPAAEPSRIWLSETFAGRWALRGDLSADDGALLATWLDRRRHALLQTAKRAPDAAPDAEPAPTPKRPMSELTADALVGLVRDGAGAKRPGRVGLMLHADLRDLSTVFGDDLPKRPAHTDANLDISDDTLWALLADAEITPVFWNSGQPLSYGRSRRLAPETLRQVLAHRDRTCRFPGCDQPVSRSHIHHTRHWTDGGHTDPAETAAGCGLHHRGHHNQQWSIGYDPTRDESWATTPHGRDIDPTPRWKRPRPQRRTTRPLTPAMRR